MKDERPKPNWPLLAATRLFLAGVVLITHLDNFQPNSAPFEWMRQFSGFCAVACFLMISGYSIRHTIEKNPTGYYWRRFLRIYPLYLFALGISVIPYWLSGHVFGTSLTDPMDETTKGLSALEWLGNLFLLSGLVVRAPETFFPAWTLAVECMFYLAAPLLMRLNRSHIDYVIIASLISLWLVNSFWAPMFSHNVTLLKVPCLFGFWLIGWRIYQGEISTKWKTWIVVLPALVVGYDMQGGGALGVALIVACISVLMVQDQYPIPQKLQGMAHFSGEISYPLYLLHLPVFWICWIGLKTSDSSLLFVAALVASVLAYLLIDRPFRVRRKTKPVEAIATAI